MGAKWEKVDALTSRMSVPGGWLVRSLAKSSWSSPHGSVSTSISISTCFVPDPGQLWSLDRAPKDPDGVEC